MHLVCMLGMIFPLNELSAWRGRQGQLPRKKCGPNALKAFFRPVSALMPHSSGEVWWVGARS